MTPRSSWFLGEFVCTAIDYLGEAGIGKVEQISLEQQPLPFATWPWISSWCGDLDLIGTQKAPSLARDVAWGTSPIEMCVQRPVEAGKKEAVSAWGWPDELQSWTWPGSEGRR